MLINFECSSVGRPDQVFYGGEVLPEIRYRDEIGQAVMHSYEIYNGGPWKVPYLQVVVSWPYQVENGKQIGKWLLYMDERPTVDGKSRALCSSYDRECIVCNLIETGDGECIMDPKQVNILDLPKRPGLVEAPLDHISRTLPVPTISDIEENEIASSYSSESRTRKKRQVVILPEAIVDNEGRTRHVVTMV